jgi:hypothetical protein
MNWFQRKAWRIRNRKQLRALRASRGRLGVHIQEGTVLRYWDEVKSKGDKKG